MKTKIFGKMTALVFVLFHSACEPDETLIKPTVPPSGNWKMVSISANENENFEIQDGYFNLWTDNPQPTLNGTFTVVALRQTDNSSWKDTLQCSRVPETLPMLLLASP